MLQWWGRVPKLSPPASLGGGRMANPWFRMYSEFAHDPKIQTMPIAVQRHVVMLFCLRCEGKLLSRYSQDEIAYYLQITPIELGTIKALLLDKEIIDDRWDLLNWDKRQFISDSSTERTQKYRERKRASETLVTDTLPSQPVTGPSQLNENIGITTSREQGGTSHVTAVTVGVTAPEQNRTEKRAAHDDKKRRPAPVVSPGVFDLPLANKTVFEVPGELYEECVSAYPGVSVMAELAKMRVWLITNPKKGKTRAGMPRFINTWLGRAQDDASKKTGGNGNGHGNGKNTAATANANVCAALFDLGIAPSPDSEGGGAPGIHARQGPGEGDSSGVGAKPRDLLALPTPTRV